VEDWNRADEYIRRKHEPGGKTRLGWYHTHPDQGIFFSSKDKKAHEVFKEPHQFALVVDPRGMEAGLFHWTHAASSNAAGRSVTGPICFSLARRRR
jgi:proteasome lid subunit RPN8/RPN11